MSRNLGPNANIDVVLCGGTYQAGDIFLPTTYAHSDDFGMLGGEMRVIAAVARARRNLAQHILFSGGKSKKGAALRGGEHIPAPPAAAVYASQFMDMFLAGKDEFEKAAANTTPILLDATSSNTNANMLYSLQLAQSKGWRDMTVISNEYHMPRVQALYSIIKEKLCMDGIHTIFLAAENIVREAHPGLYDDFINEAYGSEAGQLRIASEARGLADMRTGRYSFSEVQASNLASIGDA